MIFPELPPPTALVGMARSTVAEVELKAADAYRTFLSRCDEHVRRFDAVEARMVEEARQAGASNFHELCWLHDLAVEVTTRAKESLNDVRRTLDVLHKALSDVYRNVEGLGDKGTASGTPRDWALVEVVREEQTSLRTLKSALQAQIGRVTKHKNVYLDRLRAFQSRAQMLGRRIRGLGPEGRAWYEHLHAHKRNGRVPTAHARARRTLETDRDQR